MNIPTLETDRLTLRPIMTSDLPDYVGIWSDPEFTRYIGGPNTNPDRVWHAMAGNTGCWNLTGVGPLSVVERATGQLVGRAGLWDEPGWPGVELVWFIGRPWWGRGYAGEAAGAAGTWAFANRPLDELVTVPHRDNLKSRRVAEKLGMTLDRAETIHGDPSAVYVISRARWEELAGQ